MIENKKCACDEDGICTDSDAGHEMLCFIIPDEPPAREPVTVTATKRSIAPEALDDCVF